MTQPFFDNALKDSSKLDEVFMLGYDAWGDGEPIEEYLNGCHASRKYQQGTWHVLEKEGNIVSALILYDNGFKLPEASYGIGSVATRPNLRNAGLATDLIKRVIDNLSSHEVLSLYLFSDIDMSFYERFGFAAVRNHERKGLMVLEFSNHAFSSHATDSIEYF